MHDIQKKVVVYDIKKHTESSSHILVWFKIIINFQNEMQNLTKFTHFENFIFIQQWLTQNMWSIGATTCFLIISCKRFHSKILSYEKILKKTHNPFIK